MKKFSFLILVLIVLLSVSGMAMAATLTLPDGVTVIEEQAFYGDTSLDTVVLPENITRIDSKAFAYSSVKRIYLPAKLSYIASDAFTGCSAVVGYGTDNTYASGFFDSKTNLSFERNNPEETPLEYFTFTDNDDTNTCTLISYTGSDPEVVIPSRDGNGRTVTRIAHDAFSRKRITSVVMPDTITRLGYNAFENCTYLSNARLSAGLTSLTPYDGSGGIFRGCTSLTSIDIPSSVTAIGSNTFNGCSNLTEVILHEGLAAIGSNAFSDCSNIGEITLPRSMQTIGDNAFYNCGMTDITIPDTVVSIGAFSFYNCDNLTYISMPDSVKSIGENAFYDCDAIVGMDLSSSLTSIGAYAFRSCNALAELTIPNSVRSIGSHTFYECTSLASIDLSTSLTTIPNNMFDSCRSLSYIDLPDSITTIGDYAFNGCRALAAIDMPSGLKTVSNYVFRECTSLASIELPSGVTSLGNNVFSDCTALVYVNLPNTIKTIGTYSFSGCTSLTSIIWPTGTVTIMSYMFDGCTSLNSITLHNKVTGINSNAFRYCSSLSSIELPTSMKSINAYAFADSGIVSIVIPSSIISIGDNAFYDCDKLTDITIPTSVKSMGTYVFSDCDLLPYVELPEGLTSISNYLFYSCDALTTVKIPSTIKTIGNNAFYGCDSLRTITLPSGVQSVGSYVFYSCDKFESIVIPQSVTSIGSNAFAYCRMLTIYGVEGSTAENAANQYEYVQFESISFPSQNASSGATLSGTVTTDDGTGVGDIAVIVSDSNRVQRGVATTSDTGAWSIAGLSDTVNYLIEYLSDSYLVTGENTANAGDDLQAIASLPSETSSNISFSICQNGNNISSAIVGTEIDFSVISTSGSWVRLVVDGKAYEEYPVYNGQTSFSRAFSSAGTRSIQFESFVDGAWSEISPAQTLVVTSSGTLTAPVINNIPNYVIGTQNGVMISWSRVKNATKYTAYLYNDNTRLWPESMNDTLSTTTNGLSIVIPTDYLRVSGTYNIQIVASGEGYSSATGTCDFLVTDTAETISLLPPEQGTTLPFGDPFTVTVVSSLNDAYFKVSCKDQNGGEVFVEAASGKKTTIVTNEPGLFTIKAIGIDADGVHESSPINVTVQEPQSISVIQTNQDERNYSQYAYHQIGKTIHFQVTTDHTTDYIKIEDSASTAVTYTAKQTSNPHVWDFAVELKTVGLHEYTFTSQNGYQDLSTNSFPVYVMNSNSNNGSSMYVSTESGAVLYSRPNYNTSKNIPFLTTVEVGNGLFGEYSLIKYQGQEYFVETSTLSAIPSETISGQRSGIIGITIQESSFSSMTANYATDQDGFIKSAYMTMNAKPCNFAYTGDAITYTLETPADIDSVNAIVRYLPAAEFDMDNNPLDSGAWQYSEELCTQNGSCFTYTLNVNNQGLYELEFQPVSSSFSNVCKLEVLSTFGVRKTTPSTFYLKDKEEIMVWSSPCRYFWRNQYLYWDEPLNVIGDAGNGIWLVNYRELYYAFIDEDELYIQKNPVTKRGYIFISQMVSTQSGRGKSNEETKNKAEWLLLDAGCSKIKTFESATNAQFLNGLSDLASEADFNDVSYVIVYTHGNEGLIAMSGIHGNESTYGRIYFEDRNGNEGLVKKISKIQGKVHFILSACKAGSFITSAKKAGSGWDLTRMTIITSSSEDETTITELGAGCPLITVLYDQCRGDSKLDINKEDEGITLNELSEIKYTVSNNSMAFPAIRTPQYYGSNLTVFYKR